ncbi:hypothetical protein [Candidatus Uabimicrobium amorphum]|uniref:Uncharacterized protein n=1 Tax=Uabimicrobium amorphum TaxID=2596890 RepID=A0A5S9F6T7_UABAM|nr:hypothetical protein [Candidatus Uabimicrobium amorphum]BBM88237.1 hypothetical protein UABAM_06658 [Candidatus Uabimicrobium amorphum]
MIKVLFIVSLCWCLGCQSPAPQKPPKPLFEHFAPRKDTKNPAWGNKLQDIKNHEVFYENNFEDLVTTAHEATHDISIHFRMNEQKYYANKINAFYVFDNHVAIIENPPVPLSKVYAFIPKVLRGELFAHYFPSPDYENNPLYIWEEWVAYTNGAEVGLDLVQNELWKQGRRDTLLAMLEFLVYSAALVQAAQQLSPQYYKEYENFRKFFAWNAQRTWRVYKQARDLAPFDNKSHREYLQILQSNQSAVPLFSLIQEYMK